MPLIQLNILRKLQIKELENCTLLTLPSGWLVCEQAKANVYNVPWDWDFSWGESFLFFFLKLLPFKAVSVVVKMFILYKSLQC